MTRLSGNACPFSPNIRFSRTVSHGNTEPCWEIRIPLESGRVRSVPSINTEPPSGGMNPAMIFISVDLPQPEGPTRATNSPSWTVRLTSWTTSSRPFSEGKLFLRPLTSILVLGIAPPGPLRALQYSHGRIQCEADQSDHDHPGDDQVIAVTGIARVHDHIAQP